MRLGLVQIPVALDQTNISEMFRMCASANMAIYAMKVTKLEVNDNLAAYQPDILIYSVQMMSASNMRLNKVQLIHKVS